MKKIFEICQDRNLNVSFTWQRINNYSIEIYKLSRKTPMPLGSWDVRHIC